jgi:DNA invertase Pin-like site-specific DNA recombinase
MSREIDVSCLQVLIREKLNPMSTEPNSFEPFVARDGQELVCAIVSRARASNGDRRNLDDQIAQCKAFVACRYSGKIRYIEIEIEGCGEQVEYRKISELVRQIANRSVDLVIAVALSRISRSEQAYRFCQRCVNSCTRVITLDDHIDTAVCGWQLQACIAELQRETFNRNTSARIRRGQQGRFRQGGMLTLTTYGYCKPPGAKTDREWQKDPEAEPVIREMFRMLENGSSYSEVAAWLNQSNVRTGPHCKHAKWSSTMVRRFVHMPLLKGQRIRRCYSRRVCQQGGSRVVEVSIDTRDCPELAFFTQAYFDYVIDLIDRRSCGQ